MKKNPKFKFQTKSNYRCSNSRLAPKEAINKINLDLPVDHVSCLVYCLCGGAGNHS